MAVTSLPSCCPPERGDKSSLGPARPGGSGCPQKSCQGSSCGGRSLSTTITLLFLRDPGGSPQSPPAEIAPSRGLASVAATARERSPGEFVAGRHGGRRSRGSGVTAVGADHNNYTSLWATPGQRPGPRGADGCQGQRATVHLPSYLTSPASVSSKGFKPATPPGPSRALTTCPVSVRHVRGVPFLSPSVSSRLGLRHPVLPGGLPSRN